MRVRLAFTDGGDMNIYVASSWRNPYQQVVVEMLRRHGHAVYDYRHPAPGNDGFSWSEIDRDWQTWSPVAFRDGLESPIADRGFGLDMVALRACEVCVLVQPCGRSAHLELGWAAGAGKKTFVLLADHQEPELMYKMCGSLCLSLDELVAEINAL